MANETAEEIGEETPPPGAKEIQRDMFDWINAGSNIAVIIFGLVTLWMTIRISGLEDYFRSEVSQRNQEIIVTSQELHTARAGVEDARRALGEIKSQRDALEIEIDQINDLLQEKENDLLERIAEIENTRNENERLLQRSREIKAVAEKFEKENALRDFYHRIFNADQTIRGTTQIDLYERITINPGEQLINVLSDQFEKYPNKNEFSKELMQSLSRVCTSKVSNTVNLNSMIIKPPTLSEDESFIGFKRLNSNREQNEHKTEEAAYYIRKENYKAEIDQRQNSIEKAKKEAYERLYLCAADFLKIGPEEFDRGFGYDVRAVFDHYTHPYAKSLEPLLRTYSHGE